MLLKKKARICVAFTNQLRSLTRQANLLLLFLLIGCSITYSAAGQEKDKFAALTMKVSINVKSVSLTQVLESLEKQTSYSFTYEKGVFNNIPVAELQLNTTLGGALEYLQKNYKLLFSVGVKNIGVKPDGLSKTTVQAQRVIKGRVTEADSGNPLSGVTIQVKGSGIYATTDNDGFFSIKLPDGNAAVLTFSSIQYKGIDIKTGSQDFITVQLSPDKKQLQEVVVSARKRVNNENALLDVRKNAATVSDGISAKSIEKTASITTTQALQRVSGVTITDDKYVAVRGLGDRSVIAQLNGARLSSSDPDRTTVPLDLVPAALLDNLTVFKTLTPDKPADASSGIIELKTKSVPSSMVLSFTAQVGYNSTIGLGGEYNSFRNAKLGFWGQKVKAHNLSQDFLGLKELYPGGRPQIQQLFIDSRYNPALTAEANRINNIMLGFDPVITTSYQRASPNQVYSATFGNNFKLFKRNLGVIISGNYYNRTEDRYQAELNQWSIYQGIVTGTPIYKPLTIPGFITPNSLNLGKYLSYKENSGTQKLNYGLLAGLTYQFNNRHEISAQYLGSRGAQTEGSSLIGKYENTGLEAVVYNKLYGLRQNFRIFSTVDVQGEHKFWKKEAATRLSWSASVSSSSQNEPDYRFVNIVQKQDLRYLDANGVGIGTNTYGLVVGTVHGVGPLGRIVADPNGRRFRKLDEDNKNFKADLVQPFKLLGQTQEVKIGFNMLERDRTFSENVLGLPNNYDILNKSNGNVDALVSYSNIGLLDPSQYNEEGQPRVGGFIYQTKKSPNNYSGKYNTNAFYTMADMRLSRKFRLIGGARWESTDIRANVDTNDVYIDPLLLANPNFRPEPIVPNTSVKEKLKPYFSGNLIYTPVASMNLRFAFSQALARPELREITNIYQFDPFQFAVVSGNPALRNQLTRNADFRWEWFTNPGEVLSVSLFGKLIDHQLTKVFILNSLGNQSTDPEYPIVKYINDPEQARVYGIEIEARKNLGKLWRPLKHLYIGTNSLIAESRIEKNAERLRSSRIIDRNASAYSPIFEQAPYVINAYLDYDNPKTKTNINVSFNMVGERLVQVQLDGSPDLYDRPVPVLDLVFSQHVFKRFIIKGFAKNLLNPAYEVVYATPRNKGNFYGNKYTQHKFYKGSEFLIGITYNIF